MVLFMVFFALNAVHSLYLLRGLFLLLFCSLGKTAKPCDQFIMGLGTFKTHWQRQVQYFGHEKRSQYSCLILDNRGMGGSDKPLARYSTTEMAKDTLELIDFIGWTSLRQLHIVGVSMGGMIAQELVCYEKYLYSSHADFDSFSIPIQALMIPDRVASLSLVSTAARLVNTVVSSFHARRYWA